MKAKFFSLMVFAGLCIPGIVSNAQAQCSNATLQGEYMFHTQGTVAPAGTPRVDLAVLTFDGNGNYTSRFITNDNGVITRGTLLGLSYQVNADCTGVGASLPRARLTSGHASPRHRALVAVLRGSRSWAT